MKKQIRNIFGAAALLITLAFPAYAQDESEEPYWHYGGTMVAQPIPGDLDFTKSAYAYWGTSEAKNIMTDGNVYNPSKYPEPGTWMFQNPQGIPGHEAYADFLVTGEVSAYYTITADTGTKRENGIFMNLTIYKGTDDESGILWEEKIEVPNNMEWNVPHKDGHPYGIVDELIPVGTHLFRITFCADENEAYPKYDTFHVHKINFEASATKPTDSSLRTYIAVIEDGNQNFDDEAGYVTITADGGSTTDNTVKVKNNISVKIVATAYPGYKFSHFIINDESIENATYYFDTTQENYNITAVFEYVGMENSVPGAIDLYKNYDVIGFGGNPDTKPLLITREVYFYNEATEAYDIPETITFLQEIRGIGSVSFRLDVAESATYPISAFVGKKTEGYSNPTHPCSTTWKFIPLDDNKTEATVGPVYMFSTERWTNFRLQRIGEVYLEKGKYELRISFVSGYGTDESTVNDRKETCNLYDIVIGERKTEPVDPNLPVAEKGAVYDFYQTIPFCKLLNDPVDEGGLAYYTNYDFINKLGATANTDNEMMTEKVFSGYNENGVEQYTWVGRTNRVISLADGQTYNKQTDGTWKHIVIDEMTGETVEQTGLDKMQPFIVWNENGPARTIWMKGHGTTDEWKPDTNYNAATEEDWTPSMNSLAFIRNANSGSRQDTYIQFPAVNGDSDITVWAGHAGGNYATELRVKIVPVVDGIEQPAFCYVRPLESAAAKRYYKLTEADLDKSVDENGNRIWADPYKGEGKVAYRIGCYKSELYLYKVQIGEAASTEPDPIDPDPIEPETLAGDANGNGEVTVADAIMTANVAVGKEVEGFVTKAADVNGDAVITVSDAVGIIDIVLNQPAQADTRAIGTAQLAISDLGATFGVSLENAPSYVALQADIRVPAGMTVESVVPGPAAVGHSIATRRIDANTLRVILYNLNGRSFLGGAPLIELTLSGNEGELTFGNIIACDAEGGETLLGSASGYVEGTTGTNTLGSNVAIAGGNGKVTVNGAAGLEVSVSTLDGKTIKRFTASDSETIEAAAGAYIVKTGSKVAKVIVK